LLIDVALSEVSLS